MKLLNLIMKERLCTINDCKKKYLARGYCSKHYLRWRKHGDALFTKHKEKCQVEGCHNKHYGNGYCEKHYKRILRHQDPFYLSRMEPLKGTLTDRFMKSYIIDDISGCWNWSKNCMKQGYGQIDFNDELGKRKTIRAHRLSYRIFKGDIKNGLFVCHTCDNPKCVNPDHLWLGTHSENMMDMDKKGRRNLKRKKK